MKKKLLLILSILLILTVFSGCCSDRAERLAFVQKVVDGYAAGMREGKITLSPDGKYSIEKDYTYDNITYVEISGSSPNLSFEVEIRQAHGPSDDYWIQQDGKGGFLLNGESI